MNKNLLKLLLFSLFLAIVLQGTEVNMSSPPARTLVGRLKTAGVPKAPSKTVITSETLEMVSGLTENTFRFYKNVHVVGTNLNMTSDQMVVTAARAAGDPNDLSKVMPAALAPGQNQMGTIHKIVGLGNVHILQEGRESVSGRAEFFPKENKVVLTDNPRVIDSQAIVSGWRITLFQGERRVMVEQDPKAVGGMRPTVDLAALPDMGFDPKKDQTPPTASTLPGQARMIMIPDAPSKPSIQK